MELTMSRKHSKSKDQSSQSGPRGQYKPRKHNLTWLWFSLGALLVAGVGILLLSQQARSPAGGSPSPTALSVVISPSQAYAKFQEGAFILDVRSQAEWDQFHIKGSTLIPLNELSGRLAELPRDKDIVVVCLSGHRSQSGAAALQQAGFERVYSLDGGMQAWKDANYPVEK
jgi:rhodanese-related sulfurtransferase